MPFTFFHQCLPLGDEQCRVMGLLDIAVDNEHAGHPEDRSSDVATGRNFLAREGKKDHASREGRARMRLEPEGGRAFLIAETKRTPLGGRVDDLPRCVFQCHLPNLAGQFGYLRCSLGPVGSLPRGPRGPC